MSTLLYSPGIKVYVDTADHGVLDLSNDLTDGQMTRRSDGVSTFDFGLQNVRRKYDGIFAPNDRIAVVMKRFTWLRTFTGYLNSVPLLTAWPTRVQLSSSCSLKRLQYWYWDPGLMASQNLVAQAMSANKNTEDGGITNVVLTLMNNVIGWPPEKIHIAGIPPQWFEFAHKIAKDVDARAEEADALATQFYAVLGGAGQVAGNVGGIGGGGGKVTGGTLKPGSYGGEKLSANQLYMVETIWNVGKDLSMSNRDILIALIAAKAESGYNPKARNPRSDASGLFQMRPSMGWGTLAQVLDPTYAAKKFFTVLKGYKNRDNYPPGVMAQKVERSEDASGGIYTKWIPMATALINTLSKSTGGSLGTDPSFKNQQGRNWTSGKTTGSQLLGTALKLVTDHPRIPYHLGNDSPPHTPANKIKQLDCSSFVQWVYYQTLGSLKGLPRTSQEQDRFCRSHGKIISAKQGMATKGALMFRGNPPGHIEISLGNGKQTVGAHRSGTFCSVINNTRWTHAGLPPNVDYSADGGGTGSIYDGSGGEDPGAAPVAPGIQVGKVSEQPWYNPDDPYDKLFGNNPWVPQFEIDTAASEALGGIRAMLNDQPFLPYLKNLFGSTMRSFCSAPNGDLIAWFPDYYGIWGTAAAMVIEPVELMDFSVEWSDDFFVTHQYTVAPPSQQGLELLSGVAAPVGPLQAVTTVGIATVDVPAIMYSLFGLEADKAQAQEFINYIFKRFGARPDFQQMPGVVGPRGEFFSALFLFMRQWAYQYNANVPVTFMPELWPGMLIKIPSFDFQAYVTTVTHSFKMGPGGGFQTSVNIAAPARLAKGKGDKSGALIGLPIAGGLGPPKAGGK